MKDPVNGSLEKFQNDWNMVRNGIKGEVSDEIVEYIYYEAVKKHDKHRTQIENYELHAEEDPPHPDRNFAYLYKPRHWT